MSLCGDVLESESGQFGYIYQGKFDDVSVNCDWSIKVPGNKPAYLKVKRLHIETTQCAQSILEVRSNTGNRYTFSITFIFYIFTFTF